MSQTRVDEIRERTKIMRMSDADANYLFSVIDELAKALRFYAKEEHIRKYNSGQAVILEPGEIDEDDNRAEKTLKKYGLDKEPSKNDLPTL